MQVRETLVKPAIDRDRMLRRRGARRLASWLVRFGDRRRNAVDAPLDRLKRQRPRFERHRLVDLDAGDLLFEKRYLDLEIGRILHLADQISLLQVRADFLLEVRRRDDA